MPIGSVRFVRYRGKMYSCRLFPYGGLGTLYVNHDVLTARFTENCPRILEFKNSIDGRRLEGHVFKRIGITSPDVWEVNCFIEADCMSFNVGPLQDGEHWCELSDSDHVIHPDDLVYASGMSYNPVVVRKTLIIIKE